MKLISFLIECVFWLGIFASPFLIFLLAAFFIYISTENINYCIPLVSIGTILGIIFAEWARRKHGSSIFWSRISGSPELDNLSEEEKNKPGNNSEENS